MATSQLTVGTLLHKQHVYASSEMWFRAAGRGVIAAKGGSRQRNYLCDQQNQGCKARALWSRYSSPFINLSPFFSVTLAPNESMPAPSRRDVFFSGTMLTLVCPFMYIYKWASIHTSIFKTSTEGLPIVLHISSRNTQPCLVYRLKGKTLLRPYL